MSRFWHNWFTIWCLSVVIFGIVLTAGGLEATSGPTQLFLELLHGPEPVVLGALMRFSLGVCGPVSIALGLTTLAAIRAADLLGPRGRSTWLLASAGVASWFVLDSSLSIATGYALNVIPNTLFMAAWLLGISRSGVLKAG